MAMNATQVTLNVKGVNKTGKVFKQISASAFSVGKSVALFGGAALAASAAAFAATAKHLGHLSDVAMQAGVSANEVTKLSTAMNVLGIKSQTPEALAMAFQKMTKAIGVTGVDGFKKAIAAIGQMKTAEERSAAAMAVFGKSGLDFMPLIEAAAKDGGAALEDVIRGMSGISDSAAEAGDRVADAMTIMTDGAKTLWGEAIGAICSMFDSQFEGGIRQAAMNGVAYLEYFTKLGYRHVKNFCGNASVLFNQMGGSWTAVFERVGNYLVDYFKAIGKFLKGMWNTTWQDWRNGKWFGSGVEDFVNAMDEAGEKLWKNVDWTQMTSVATDDLEQVLSEKLTNAAKAAAAVSKAAVATASTEGVEDVAERVQNAVRNARNEFMQAGSYKATTMSIRADYGKNTDKTVRAVNSVKAVNEKIQKATEASAAALAGIGTV